MPGTPEHPVILGDLICAERRDGEGGHGPGYVSRRPATVADLVSALRAEGVLVVESSVRHNWPAWAIDVLRYDVAALAEAPAVEILDALAEAQPFPPAGG